MLKKLTTSLSSEKSLVLLDQAVFSGNSFVATALLARFLGIEHFGIFSSVVLAVYLLISMSNALIIQPMQVAYTRFANAKSYLGFTMLAQLMFIALVLLLVNGLALFGKSYFSELNSINMLAVSGLAAFWLLHDYFRKLFLAIQHIKNTIVVDCILASIQLGGIIGLQVAHLLTLNAAIITLTISYVMASTVAFIISNISFSHIGFQKKYFTYHRKEGGFLFLSSLLQWWSSNLFVVASGLFLGVAALGAFRLVQSMFGVLNLLLQTYENYVLPKASKLFASSHIESKHYLQSITKKGGLLFALVLVPLFVFSKQAILLFGGVPYAEYHFVVRGMVVLYAIIYFGYSVRLPIRLLTLNQSFFIGYCISFAFSALTFHYLLNTFGISGAIAGLIVNQLLMLSYWHLQLKKHNYLLWK